MNPHDAQGQPDDGALRFYGRRQGRRLRAARQRLMDSYLPLIRVARPERGQVLDPRLLFGSGVGVIWMEIGFGAGENLVAQAMRHRDIGFIGCEAYLNGIAALLPRLVEADLGNVRIFDDDARDLLGSMARASLARIDVLFPDPWPKSKHHNRRLISPANLNAMACALRQGGELRLASDHPGYVRWMLEHLTRHRAFEWMARSPTDWRTRPGDACVTRYEQKALARGAVCTYLSFRRRADTGV